VAAVLSLDFDDTIVTNNVTHLLFERFAGPGWREADAAYKAGKLSVEESNAAAFAAVDIGVSREDMAAFVLEVAGVRPGLLELADWAHWHGWQVAVVSNGFDIAVDAVLDHLGLDRIARHCGRTRRAYRWQVRYQSPRGIEIRERFKVAYVGSFLQAGDFVAYAGDGASDVEAASLAHAVFARSTLLERLSGARERVYPFATFHDVVAVLEQEAGAWLESFSSTTAAEA
jgi:2,3-diketo-5-methylthio-1-phosphopentane phosphatase